MDHLDEVFLGGVTERKSIYCISSSTSVIGMGTTLGDQEKHSVRIDYSTDLGEGQHLICPQEALIYQPGAITLVEQSYSKMIPHCMNPMKTVSQHTPMSIFQIYIETGLAGTRDKTGKGKVKARKCTAGFQHYRPLKLMAATVHSQAKRTCRSSCISVHMWHV